MRNMLMFCLIVFAVILVFGSAYALQGPCATCHTMHNSQYGLPMNLDGSPMPNQLLLRGNCLGCHAQNANGALNITLDGIPQVLHNNATPLAGGNFRYGNGTNHMSHNVLGLPAPYGDEDQTFHLVPPGYLSGYDPANPKYDTSVRLRCAGRNGCHGNRDQTDEFAAIKGGHHFNDTMLQFPPYGTINESLQANGTGNGGTSDSTTTGKSYRFLYNVNGGEDNDWQATVGPNDHNEYKGAVFGGRGQTQTWANVLTISDLCAECHGKFHAGGQPSAPDYSGIGSSSPWLRHPTDAVIPNTLGSEYAAMSTTYDPDTPVARQTIPNNKTTPVAPGTDIVMCLSCHRVHGSLYASILRWDYNTGLSAGQGCLRCHTQKSAYP